MVGAAAGWILSGGRGFFVGLAMAAGWVLGDLADRRLVASGRASPETLARAGQWVRRFLGGAMLGLSLFLLVSFALTGQPIVLVGALIATVGGVLMLRIRPAR